MTVIVGSVALAIFMRAELRSVDPISRVGLLTERLLRSTVLVTCITSVFLQVALHRPPLATGMTATATSVGVLLGTQTIGRPYKRWGRRSWRLSGCVA